MIQVRRCNMVNAGKTENGYTELERMRALIERLNAYIEQFHGGSVEMVSFENRVLRVRLGGACLGCPLSPSTLHGWVAGTVHQFFPDVQVEAAES
jgi:Fe-S cluster biogenesis protein NfuA